MKKFTFLLAFGLLGATLTVMPTESSAATVTVTYDTSSGIADADLTATLDDGTVLGFRSYYDAAYFCGAISTQEKIVVPDSISFSGSNYAVCVLGYSGCDFDDAQSVIDLTIPSTIETISYLPSTIKVLHVNSYINNVNSDLSNLSKVLVPENTLASYYGNRRWSDYVLINEEGKEPLKITINMTKPGEFAQLLLQQTDNWYKVNDLTVTGNLNTDDLNVFKRMRQLTKLDLSQAVIADIPDNFDGSSYINANRDGFNILEELSLPEVNTIGYCAFSQCYRLKKIIIPKVKIIGDGVFAQLGASQITLPEGVTSIGDYAFYSSKLESIAIPSSITKISSSCFEYCGYLKSIEIPLSVTKIENYAFGHSGLTSVTLPGVKNIGYYAFNECAQLSEVKFSEGLSELGGSTFRKCTALTEIDLPGSLTYMYNCDFEGCYNIKKVTSRAVVPPTHNNNSFILYGCDMTDVKLYVPAMSIDQYRVESGWKSFYTILPMEGKTSNAYIYDYATINDAAGFTDDLDMAIDWRRQNRNGSDQYYCGALDFNGSSTLSMHNYRQYQCLGDYSYYNNYSDDAHFTSLIANGTMRADSVQTTLRTNSTYVWYFISLPYDVKVSDITYIEGTQFAIRKYSGYNRAQQTGETWVNLTSDDVMNAYEGYILRCNKENVDFVFPAINNTNKNKVFEKESVVMPLGEYLSEFEHNRSWNLIGNPYPCYFDSRRLDITSPITVWNRYNNSYDAYSPIDDEFILHPSQAFFVQRPVNKATITFDKAGRQKNAEVQPLEARAKARASMKSERRLFNVVMSNGANTDRTRVVVNSNASLEYELDKDASKFIADDNKSMLVYTIENGVKYAINERPLGKGIVGLGFYAPTDGSYTLSLSTTDAVDVVLIDHEANTKTVLSGDYHFDASAGYNNTRFSLGLGGATGISNIVNDNAPVFNVVNGVVTANTPYHIYTLDGCLVGSGNAGTETKLAKGIYVINCNNVNHKIVIK